jgi:hypothetical protein
MFLLDVENYSGITFLKFIELVKSVLLIFIVANNLFEHRLLKIKNNLKNLSN